MKNLILIILIVFCCNILLSQESIVFDKAFNWDGGGGVAHDIKQTDDGGYICVGGVGWGMFDERFLVFKLDSLGELQWENYFSTQGSELQAVDITKTGNYIAAGKTQNNDEWLNTATLVMFGQNGDTLWLKEYPYAAEVEGETVFLDTYLYDVIFTADNSMVAAGYAGVGSYAIPYILKTDMNGDTLWTYMPLPFQEGNQILILSIAETPEGDYVAVGKADKQVYGGEKDYAPQRGIIIKLSSDGELIYFKEWTDIEYTLFEDVSISINGSYYICGANYTPPSGDIDSNWESLIVKVNSEGNTENVIIKVYGKGMSSYSITLDENENIITQNIFGINDTEWSSDILIQKLDAVGNVLFQKTIGGADVNVWYGEIISTSDNGIAFSGHTNAGIEESFAWVVKIDSLGNGNYMPGWINEVVSNTFEKNIDVYPNPAYNKLYIYIDSFKECSITFYSIDGKIVMQEKANLFQNQIDISTLPNGVYLLEITDEKHRCIEKIIINH